METFSFVMDIILLIGGMLGAYYAKTVGGSIGRNSMVYMTIGFFILGFAHLSETALYLLFPDMETSAQEVIHRVIVLVGFCFVLFGFSRLSKFARP